ncbi:MAG: twinkle protein [Verrucomicrobiales bacterium]|jgi:twinkle protein
MRELLPVFEYAYRRFGITQFVIDSLLRCGIREDDYEAQKQFSQALADFANKFPVHCHLGSLSTKRSSKIINATHWR